MSGFKYVYKSGKGLDEKLVREISALKKEPKWMLGKRLEALRVFNGLPLPQWGSDLSGIDFSNIHYYLKPLEDQKKSWDDVPDEVRETFEKIGVPKAERDMLAGVKAQYDSEVIYGSLKKSLEKKGIVFLSMDEGLAKYPELVKKYWGSVVPLGDNKLAALNSAVWSGGSFVYVPKGVEVGLPLQAYFRINTERAGQFERTLIIADERSKVHYLEGCSAPAFSTSSLHSAVVEVIVEKQAKVTYTTVQNWYKNIYNLVTKRALVKEEGEMRWVDGNLGCIAESETITTPNGVKTIESVRVGEKVLSYDERKGKLCFRKIVAKRGSGKQRVYLVSVGERKIRVTANHPFYSYVYDSSLAKKLGRYELDYVRADELQKVIIPRISINYGFLYKLKLASLRTVFQSENQYKKNLTMVRQRISRLMIDQETTEDLMWLFGYWIGDGNLDIKYAKSGDMIRWAKVGFSCPANNRARGKLIKVMKKVIDCVPTERKDGVYLSWNSKELAELFILNGFTGKAIDKRVPKWVWSLPEGQRLAFIAGYLDADGNARGGRFSIKSVNRKLLGDVGSLLVTLGITSRTFEEFSKPREVMILGNRTVAHGSYRLDFQADQRLDQHVSKFLYDQVKEKRARVWEQRRRVGRSKIQLGEDVEIVSVKVSEEGKDLVSTWDIEVEGTGNFVCEGFIVHNSKLTMKYPSCILAGKKARGEMLSIAWAGKGQHQDTGAKMIHLAPETTSQIISKSISKDGGRSSYRGLVHIAKGATGAKSKVVCDALILDDISRSDTYPTNKIFENDASLEHEATVGKIGEEQLFYLMSRGIKIEEAEAMIVNGFLEPIMKQIPLEYAIEMNRLVEMEMEGSVG